MTSEQISFALAIAIKPFVLLVMLGFLLCIRFAVIKYVPEGRLKRLLLIRLNKPRSRRPDGSAAAPKVLN